MKPERSKARLAFIRSLPCCVSGRTVGVEAAHVGHRGMGQKASDFDIIPLNELYHREQHRIGLKAFCQNYNLDIPALLALLQEKPRITIWPLAPTPTDVRYGAFYRDQYFVLGLVSDGLPKSIRMLRDRVREVLTDELLARIQ